MVSEPIWNQYDRHIGLEWSHTTLPYGFRLSGKSGAVLYKQDSAPVELQYSLGNYTTVFQSDIGNSNEQCLFMLKAHIHLK